jgi:ParB family chromosome partitioning protein
MDLPRCPDTPELPGTDYQPGLVYRIPLDLLEPDPTQPRVQFDEGALADLAADLRTTGQQEPIQVRQIAADGTGAPRLLIVNGERRWRACRIAGLPTVDALVDPRPASTDRPEEARLFAQITSNCHRADLTPWDWVCTLRRLRDELGMTPTRIAEALAERGLKGWSRPAVSNHLRLLELPEWAQEGIRTRALTPSHGKLLAGLVAYPHVLERVLVDLGAWLEPSPRAIDPRAADDTAPETEPEPEPERAALTIERLQGYIQGALRKVGVDLASGGLIDIGNSQHYLSPHRLTPEDRQDCAACPTKATSGGHRYCMNPPCLRFKIDARDGIDRLAPAEQDPADPPHPPETETEATLPPAPPPVRKTRNQHQQDQTAAKTALLQALLTAPPPRWIGVMAWANDEAARDWTDPSPPVAELLAGLSPSERTSAAALWVLDGLWHCTREDGVAVMHQLADWLSSPPEDR